MDQHPPVGSVSRLPGRARLVVGGVVAATPLTCIGTGITKQKNCTKVANVSLKKCFYLLQAFSSLVNRTRVTFQVPRLSGDGQTVECEPGATSVDSASAVKGKAVSVVAIEFLVDQQRGFVSTSLLQPFQVRDTKSTCIKEGKRNQPVGLPSRRHRYFLSPVKLKIAFQSTFQPGFRSPKRFPGSLLG